MYSHTHTQVREGWEVISENCFEMSKASWTTSSHSYSSAEQPWGQGSGFTQPTEGCSKVKDTHSRGKDHLSVLVVWDVVLFRPSLILTTWPSLYSSPRLPLGLLSQGGRKWERGREREIRNTDTRQESLQINIVWDIWEGCEDVKVQKLHRDPGRTVSRERQESFLPFYLSLWLFCSDVSG